MEAVDILISFEAEDRNYCDRIKVQLKPLLLAKVANLWDEIETVPLGQDLDKAVEELIFKAEIILLLISPAAMASDRFIRLYLENAFKRHSKGEVILIPVKLKASMLDFHPIKDLKSLPLNNVPISEWENTEAAVANITTEITAIVQKFASRKQSFQQAFSTAEDFYNREKWPEALDHLRQTLKYHQTGFFPDKASLEQKIADCKTNISQQHAYEHAEKRKVEFNKKVAAADAFWMAGRWSEAASAYHQATSFWEPDFGIEKEYLTTRASLARLNQTQENPPRYPIVIDWSKLKPYVRYLLGSSGLVLFIYWVRPDNTIISHQPPDPEEQMWTRIKDVRQIDSFEFFIQKFPKSKHLIDSERAIEKIKCNLAMQRHLPIWKSQKIDDTYIKGKVDSVINKFPEDTYLYENLKNTYNIK
ncbi:TIR domain-containing protein [Runella sp.]|uniref:TIR domain-containing protein n=1 Tax=Runella sp. TaxID=1960881 RepID=UPI003018475C